MSITHNLLIFQKLQNDQIIASARSQKENSAQILDTNLFLSALYDGSLVCLLDSLFFSEYSKFIAVHFIFTCNKIKVGSRDFISTVVLNYRYVHVAELYGVLLILKLIELIFLDYRISKDMQLEINRDFKIVLNFLLSSQLLILLLLLLYQLKRKIQLIK